MHTEPLSEQAEAFYVELGYGHFSSTDATAGPWSPKTQHGGPPSALLGRAIERHEGRSDVRVARMTIEIPRPVPVGELHVTTRTVKSGRRTELVEGEITADAQTVLTARAWRFAPSPDDTPRLGPAPAPRPLPGPMAAPSMTGAHVDGYISAIEWRFLDGGGFDVPGPATAWARQRIPLVHGAADTPLTRVLTLADSAWGIAFELDHVRQFVINTDVTLALHRDPEGEWICLDSATSSSPGGSGVVHGSVGDPTGVCGHVLQSLVVAGRSGRAG